MEAEMRGTLVSNLRFLRALIGTNLRASLALRGAFWLQASFMVLNNVVYFSIWWIFFARFDDIGGWRLPDMAALYGVVASSFGLTIVLCGGLRDLARHVVEGSLDTWLTQPRPTLLQALASQSRAAGWGDFASGVAFIAACGVVSPGEIPLAIAVVLLAATVFVSSGVILHSLAFWLGEVDSLARQVWEFLITFSLYPPTLFSGGLRLLLFTALPAGFIGYLPVELLRRFSPETLAVTSAATLGYALLARAVFRAGLARYESGNRISIRA
jgi:ABC-2 type transport system permease protein